MKEQLGIRQPCEVITIVSNRRYTELYKEGNTGIIEQEFASGGCSAIIGNHLDCNWYVEDNDFKKTGRLTITKLKFKP